jgi:hypothetical protein
MILGIDQCFYDKNESLSIARWYVSSLLILYLSRFETLLVHAIEPADYLKETRSKRSLKANPKKFENYQSTKIAEKFARNNSKCFDIPPRKTQQYSKSFLFVKTPKKKRYVVDINTNTTGESILDLLALHVCIF